MKIEAMLDLVILIMCMVIGVSVTSWACSAVKHSYTDQLAEDKSLVTSIGENMPPEYKMDTTDITLMYFIQDDYIPNPAAIQINDNAVEHITTSWIIDRLGNTKRIYQTQIVPYLGKDVTRFYLDYTGGELKWKVILD